MRPTFTLVGLLLFVVFASSAPVPKKKARGAIVIHETLRSPELSQTAVITTITPDGKVLGELPFKPSLGVDPGPFSPDGSQMAVLTEGPRPEGTEQNWLVHLVDVKKPGTLPEPVCTVYDAHVCWSADGQKLYEPKIDKGFGFPQPGEVSDLTVTEHDLAKGGSRTVSFGRGQLPMDVSPDGQCWLTRQYANHGGPRGAEWQTFLTTPDTAGPATVGNTDFHPLRFLPDGKRVYAMKPFGGARKPLEYYVFDLLTNKVTPVPWPKELEGKVTGTQCLSPDGSEMVVSWIEEVNKPEGWPPHELCGAVRVGICDADGGNLRTVYESARPTTYSKAWLWRAQIAWR